MFAAVEKPRERSASLPKAEVRLDEERRKEEEEELAERRASAQEKLRELEERSGRKKPKEEPEAEVPAVQRQPMTAAEKAAAAAAAVESRAKALESMQSSKLSDLQGEACADPEARGFRAPEKIDWLLFPRALIGKIIGRGGCIIKDINEKSGARVDARDQTSDPVHVLLSGTAEAVERAKSMILDIAEGAAIALDGQEVPQPGGMGEGTSSSSGSSAAVTAHSTEVAVTQPSSAAGEGAAAAAALLAKPEERLVVGGDIVEDHMDLPKQATGKIIGTGGKQVAEIRQKTGTQVDIDKSGSSCRVRIVGTKQNIEEAKKLIAQIAEAPAPAAENLPGVAGELMEIPKNSVGRVIGAGGARIQELQERSGAKIDIDRSTEKCMVRFAGSADAVAKAKVLVTEVLNGTDRSMGDCVETLEVPPSTTGRLIGPGGKQINQIQEKSGAKVDIDKTRDPCIVRIAGSSDAVAVAQAMVLEVVQSVAVVSHPRAQDLQNSIARAAAMAQALRAGLYPGGAGSAALSQDEESIKFEIPFALADKVLGNGAWVQAVRMKTGARIIVNRHPDKCFLEMSGQPEQVIEAEQLADDAVKNMKILVANARDVPLPPPPASLLPEPQLSMSSMQQCTSFAGILTPKLPAMAKVVAPPPGAGTPMTMGPLPPGPIVKELFSPTAVAPAFSKQRPQIPPSDVSPNAASEVAPASEDSDLQSPPPSADAAIAAAIVLPARPSASRAMTSARGDSSSIPGFGTPGKPGPGDPGLPPEMLPKAPSPTVFTPAPRAPPARVQAPWASVSKAAVAEKPESPAVEALTAPAVEEAPLAKASAVEAPVIEAPLAKAPDEAPPPKAATLEEPTSRLEVLEKLRSLKTPPPPAGEAPPGPPPPQPAMHALPPGFMHPFSMIPSPWQAPVALLPMVMSPWQAAVQHLPIPPPPQGQPPPDAVAAP